MYCQRGLWIIWIRDNTLQWQEALKHLNLHETSQNEKKPLNGLNNSTKLVPQSYNCYKNPIVTRASLPATQLNSPINNPTVRSSNNSQTFTNQMIQQNSKTKQQNNKQKTSKSDDKTCLIM